MGSTSTVPLRNLTAKRSERATCPACRHNVTTVIARAWISAWRIVASATVVIIFTPLTMGVMLMFLPYIASPQFVIHSCPRCGLRLAVSTGAVGEHRYTLPSDSDDDNFIAAPKDWRPDLARLPPGMRLARSPLGLPPLITEKEMQECKGRFSMMRAQSCLEMISDAVATPSRYRVIASGEAADTQQVLYQIRLQPLDTWGSGSANVMMQLPPQYPGAKSSMPGFAECCSIKIETGRDFRTTLVFPPQGDELTSPPTNTTTVAIRAQFYPGQPIWQWKSSEGNLLWISRPFRDADMEKFEWKLCLVDEYERLVVAVDDWKIAITPQSSEGRSRREHSRVVRLYAELGANLLGEILGTLCILYSQMRRVGEELERERRSRD